MRTRCVALGATLSGLVISVGRVLPTRQAVSGLVVLLAPRRSAQERANSASITSGNVYQAPLTAASFEALYLNPYSLLFRETAVRV